MVRNVSVVIALSMFAAACFSDPLPEAVPVEGVTAIVNVRVFDGESVIEVATVVIDGNTIVAVGPDVEPPASAETIDGSGKTLFPGMIDAHTHTFDDDSLRRAAMFGITTHLDMFSHPDYFERERASERAAPDRAQADLISAGILGTAPRGHGTQYGIRIPTMETPDDAVAWIQDRQADGSDFIKLVLEDGRSFGRRIPTLDAVTYQAAIDEADRLGLLTVTHVTTLANATLAIESGSAGLAHLFNDDPITDEFVQLIAEADGFVIPTLVVLAATTLTPSGPSIASDELLGPRLDDVERTGLTLRFAGGASGDVEDEIESIRRLHEAGVTLLAGSDAPNFGTAFGVSMHREIEYFVEAGMSPSEALASATSVTADVFGLDDRGRIAPGLIADLVLVDGDPTQDILATRAIDAVWKSGIPIELTLPAE